MSTKKSAKKLNKFTSSPLIIAIAIIEVVILICACTFAWFSLGKNTTISTQWLSVEPDSGLEIDFSAANEDDYVNISQYVIKEFKFEPVTSTDGRNIYVPTTGTFNETSTKEMVFREATVNDMNSKYICIDFTLTNTGDKDMPVFLSPRSTFKVAGLEGKALRLAFYQNDGAAGDIDTTYYQTNNEEDDVVTVYFRNYCDWKQPYAYAYNLADGNNIHNKAYPGVPMTKVSDDLYYYTFSTKYATDGKDYSNPLDVIMFSNGKEDKDERKTYYRSITDNYIYTPKKIATETDKQVEADRQPYASSILNGTYPVVSPGVSVGFQRQYAPVTQIDNTSGSATSIVPAYANSIDNYSFGSNSPLFTIKQRETLSLSMIVWLEGTDPACTGETYSGREININLLFATNDNNEEEYCTYTFYDATYETWIAHETASSTGASVKPVMQLYDTENQKGYLMTASDYTDDTKTHAKTWTVSAPKSVLNNGVIFRRVNPLDENEIWNYWDTRTNSITNASYNDRVDRVTVDNTEQTNFYFTAFSDGSPTNAKDSSENGSANAPAYSCGGLWGGYKTTAVKLYDGTRSCYFANTDDEGTTGAMTINYTYQGQEVEYKASGPDYGFYTFVVPDATFKQTPATFKRYYNFNADYAINASEKQTNIKFDNAWNAGFISGRFFEINQFPEYVNDGEFITYWGDEVIYIQNDKKFKDQMDNGQWRVKFTQGNNSHYTYLYKHHWAKFENENKEKYYRYYYSDRQSEDSYGYPCVVPSDKAYTDVRIEQCSKESPPSLWNRTPAITLTKESNAYTNNSNYIFGYNTRENTNTVINVLKLTNLEHKIFFQIDTNFADTNTEVSLFAYKDYKSSAEWPGNQMEFVGTISTDEGVNEVYLKPSNKWRLEGNWFAAYFFNSVGDTWVTAEPVDVYGEFYKVTIPDGYSSGKMIWLSMKPGGGYIWNDRSYQTSDLDIPNATSSKKLYIVDTSDTGGGSWTSTSNVKFPSYHTFSETVDVTHYDSAYVTVPEIKYVYLEPGDDWDNDGAWFAAYFYGANMSDTWVKATQISDTGIYYAVVPDGATGMNWVRMKSGETGLSWDNRWNQTTGLSLPITADSLYIVTGWGENDGYWAYGPSGIRDNRVLYLDVDSTWAADNAAFAAYFYNSSTNDNRWVRAFKTNVNNRYAVVVPEGFDKLIWARMNPNSSQMNWDGNSGYWGMQTADLDLPRDNKIAYSIANNSWKTVSTSPYSSAFGKVEIGLIQDHNGRIYRGSFSTPFNTLTTIDGTIGDTDTTLSVVHESYLSKDWP